MFYVEHIPDSIIAGSVVFFALAIMGGGLMITTQKDGVFTAGVALILIGAFLGISLLVSGPRDTITADSPETLKGCTDYDGNEETSCVQVNHDLVEENIAKYAHLDKVQYNKENDKKAVDGDIVSFEGIKDGAVVSGKFYFAKDTLGITITGEKDTAVKSYTVKLNR